MQIKGIKTYVRSILKTINKKNIGNFVDFKCKKNIMLQKYKLQLFNI